MKLSAEEGFVLSRIDGPTSLQDLVSLCGLDESRVAAIVRTLASQGAIELDGEPAPAPARPAPATDAAAGPRPFSFSAIDELEAFGDEGAAPDLPLAVTAAGASDVGVVRTNNEDAFVVVDLATAEALDVVMKPRTIVAGPRGALLVVSDGVGGENAGEIASALVVDAMRELLSSDEASEDGEAGMCAAIVRANERVLSAAQEPGRTGMGATIVAALLQGTTAFFAEVGDSRAYVFRGGTLTQVSKDQTHVQMLIDQGLLTPEKAKSSVAKSVVLQAIGTTPDLVIAQRRLPLRDGDLVLLCSDGLTGPVSDADIATVLRDTRELDEACAELVALANQRGGRDNVTVVLARVGGPLALPLPSETVASMLTTTRAFGVEA